MAESRLTSQKVKIKEYLMSVKTHPTADMVYRQVKKDLPTITLATVYRNLNQMTEKGEILRLEIGKEFRYDGDINCHQHCVCDNCGKIADVMQEVISKETLQRIKTKDFQPESAEIIFRGFCKDCGC